MGKKQEIVVILGDDAKERIANADLSGFIELLAELIATERIKEMNMMDTGEFEDPPAEY